MSVPPLRIAFGAVFWRIFLVTFSIQQYIAFNKSRHLFRGHGLRRQLAGFAEFTPHALVLGLLVAALTTVAIDLMVRWLARAVVARWYCPRGGADRTALDFHLDPGERQLTEAPARRRERCGWRPGTLVLTNRRFAFYDADWHNDPDAFDRGSLVSLRVEPSGATLGSFVLGVPGRLVVRESSGRETALAVADPDGVLAWFERPDLAVPGIAPPLRIPSGTRLNSDLALAGRSSVAARLSLRHCRG
jgi:hypothetical protein